MRVLTLHKKAFEEHAGRLASMVMAGLSDGGPDAIVGVRRGGAIVCDAFCRHFPPAACALRTDVSLQRPSTKNKNGAVRKILRHLPFPVLDLMRMAEARLLAWRHRHRASSPVPEVVLPEELRRVLQNAKSPQILIIDDAIDSGDTLFAVINALKQMNPDVVARVAVFTVTTSNPRVKADYALYTDHTLIRFPWSDDYRLPSLK